MNRLIFRAGGSRAPYDDGMVAMFRSSDGEVEWFNQLKTSFSNSAVEYLMGAAANKDTVVVVGFSQGWGSRPKRVLVSPATASPQAYARMPVQGQG